MLFNSIQFALFLPVVFILYWFLARNSYRQQNILLLAASYFFYSCWDWRFLFLLLFSTLLDYAAGLQIAATDNHKLKKTWLWLSIGINLGFLGVFKYYNFFAQSFTQLLNGFGLEAHATTLGIILPVGISFYTFHGLSYIIDVYKDRIKPECNFIDYSLFVSFFPLLVAGPIERATHLLPQLKQKRTFNLDQAKDGLRQILWGLFKKVVIADMCAEYANLIFDHYDDYSGSSLFLGMLFFTFQIYGDFSGYTDIALGTARLFGIDLLRNFAYPYFSRDIAEFWRRWHISLSSWFRDYVYIPLGGSRVGTLKKVRNIFVIFLLSGFWHGAKFTFIVWGLLHALYFLPLLLTNNNRKNLDIVAAGRLLPSVKELVGMLTTFMLVGFAWIFFRAESMAHAYGYVGRMLSKSLFTAPDIPTKKIAVLTLVLTGIFFFVEWLGRENQYAIQKMGQTWKRPVRWALYYAIIIAICLFAGKDEQFIYFQF
ncbi:MBOAT family O-acyltransferase [Flavobacterium subsaxonicum]|uniref:Acyltransferase n=1 Tax=Flavobacterium subsaxonicum WB 4.1-42 = DSM 21790 TaxID=1121898 RepID=A0A0A2MWC6_9FLAO|nr:MBOAT family O-acyltransferase [Flavobacterium subsaxonicum]KGO92530.1 acyltransferase [Flavobacterium subsaxonicum WB 4.1-42 = DSM 21790]